MSGTETMGNMLCRTENNRATMGKVGKNKLDDKIVKLTYLILKWHAVH